MLKLFVMITLVGLGSTWTLNLTTRLFTNIVVSIVTIMTVAYLCYVHIVCYSLMHMCVECINDPTHYIIE